MPNRPKFTSACRHELDRGYPPVSWWDRKVCEWFGHDWETCERHALKWCPRCETQTKLGAP